LEGQRVVPGEIAFCFVRALPTKQNGAGTKPFFVSREGMPKPPLVTKTLTKRQAKRPIDMGTVMIKALSAVAAAAFIAAALTLLPGFAPTVEASTPHALAKGDRLDIHLVGRDCSQQAWPNFEASCLRAAVTRTSVREARLVTADRTR
jgi:hypothetical protein